jgi:hypothetical protein
METNQQQKNSKDVSKDDLNKIKEDISKDLDIDIEKIEIVPKMPSKEKKQRMYKPTGLPDIEVPPMPLQVRKDIVVPPNPLQDPYTITGQNVINQLMIDKLTTNNNKNYIPNSVVETAHILLSNSASSEPLTEIDKEIKLANFTETEKFLETQYAGCYQDMLWMMDQQKIREKEAKAVYGDRYDILGYETLVDELTKQEDPDGFYDVFDAPGTLRKTRTIATISRGYLGFERSKQVETINKSENINVDKSEQKPGFMDKMSGWRKGQ